MRRDRTPRGRTKSGGMNFSRRDLLQRAGWAAAAAALPGLTGRSIALAAEEISPVMARLSGYMSEARNRALPDGVMEKAKQHILDTFAAMVSGSELPPGRAALRFAKSHTGEKIATVVCSNQLCGAIEAALANGVMAHSDETDDAHTASLSHPGCAVVPATLAAGEQFGIDGVRFLRSVVLGYDVGPRVVAALGGAALQSVGHRSTHSISGIFGAAAAAGCAASLDAQQMRWLLDYTAQQCSGIAAWQRDTQHIEKAFVYAGMTARGGVTSALLVQAGWTGIDDIFSGADNFLQAEALQASPESLVDQLGERYEVTQTDIKKWAVGAPIQAPLDALEILQKRRPFGADQVREVIVRIAASASKVVNNREMPDVCLQHMVAVMLLDKTASFRAAHDVARMKDPEVLKQRAKVQLIGDAELEKAMPRREAIVEVTLLDGTKLAEHVTAVRGTPANPMPREEVVAKARDLMAPVLGARTAQTLIGKIFVLENMKNVRELRPLLQRS
jgi:2-methylcitrate dehydratase PrpD